MVTINDRSLSRRSFLQKSALAGLALASSKPTLCSTPKKRPNIILIVTDDQRWDTLGCMGNPIIQTPNLDRLAAEGVLFTNHFSTTSICMSSRASIFTGLYTRCHDIDLFNKPLTPEGFASSYPAVLRKAGYRTAFIGKYGLGGKLPEDGYDYFKGFSGQGQYFHDVDGKEVHLTGILGEQACEFLKTCTDDRPFCMSLSTKAPHVQDGHPDPFRYDPQYKDLYTDVDIPKPETADEKYYDAMPDFIRNSEGRTRWEKRFINPQLYQHSVKNYYRLITGVDAIVGKIRAELERLDLADNTVVIYTSDQGFFLGEHGMAGKWLMHEESIRAPLIVYDPRLPKNKRGRRKAMTLNIDFAPTIMDLAGVEAPDFIQGKSLLPLVYGKKKKLRDEMFYEHPYGHNGKIPMSEGVRDGRWKYIRYYENDPPYEELYDLKKDPAEKNNLAGDSKYRDVLVRYRSRWIKWKMALNDWKRDSGYAWSDPK